MRKHLGLTLAILFSLGRELSAGFRCPYDEILNPPLFPSEIHHELLGKGNPDTVVLIHGLDSAGVTFDTIAAELAKKHQVLIYDQRGHGKTAQKGTNYGVQVMARDLKALLDHLGIAKAHVLGHSMGARTAIGFADLFPDRVESVIIEDMELHARGNHTAETLKSRQEQAEQLAKEFHGKTFASRSELIKALTPQYGRKAESLSYRRARENPDGTMTLLFSPAVSVLYGSQGNAEDFITALERVKAPVLFVRSEPRLGTALTDDGAKRIREVRPDLPIEMVGGAGHVIHRTHPSQFLELTEAFVKQKKLPESLLGKFAPKLRAKGSIALDSIHAIEDPKARVAELANLRAEELSDDQIAALAKRAPNLQNSFEQGQYVRLAAETGDAVWLPVLRNWKKAFEGTEVAWQKKLSQDMGTAEQIILEHVMHQKGKHAAISARGLEFTKDVAASGMVPRGAALITSSGALKTSGITNVIHAVSGSRTQNGPNFVPSLEGVQLSVHNSLEVAKSNGHKRVAIPFIGGSPMLKRIGGTPEALVDIIVGAAMRNREDLELRFVLSSNEETELFAKAVQKYSGGRLASGAVEVVTGSITDFNLHGASAIVNAADMEAPFGNGLSSAAGTLDKEAKKSITSFNADLLKLMP